MQIQPGAAVLLILPVERCICACTKSKLMFKNMYVQISKNGENCAIPAMKEQPSTFVFAVYMYLATTVRSAPAVSLRNAV